MYRRDIGILLLSVFAIYWSLQHEGTYQYQKAFYFDLPVDDRLAEEEHVLPAPVVVRSLCYQRRLPAACSQRHLTAGLMSLLHEALPPDSGLAASESLNACSPI